MADSTEQAQAPAARDGRRFITEESVYGLVLVSGLIAVSGAHGQDPWAIFISVVATVVVFWAVHVYAGIVAGHRSRDGRSSLSSDARHAVNRSRGFLVGALVPSVILLLGALRVVDDETAIWVALWSDVAILGAIGYIAFTRNGSGWPMRIVGTLATASFGVIMILLKATIH